MFSLASIKAKLPLSGSKNSADNVRLKLMQKLEPRPLSQSDHFATRYLYFTVKTSEWMRHAERYSDSSGGIDLYCDENVDAALIREHFLDEYKEGVERVSDSTACMWRSIMSICGVRDRMLDSFHAMRLFQGFSGSVRDYPCIEKVDHHLIVLNGSKMQDLLEIDANSIPAKIRLKKPIDKTSTELWCSFPLRLDCAQLRIDLPPHKKVIEAFGLAFLNKLDESEEDHE